MCRVAANILIQNMKMGASPPTSFGRVGVGLNPSPYQYQRFVIVRTRPRT
jgi:hypothetical protein